MFEQVQDSVRGLFRLAVVAGVAALIGCGEPGSTGSSLPSGAMAVALVTAGADGASYTFPFGTRLELLNTSTGFMEALQLDGNESMLTETVPVGNYTASLFLLNNAPVQLVRSLNGTSHTVPATWTDAQPFTFMIAHNMTTPIVLHFSVVNLGDVTFQSGALQVSVDVSSTTSTMPTSAQETGVIAIQSQTIASGVGLETPLGLTLGESDTQSLTWSMTGPFIQLSPQESCATGALITDSASMSSTGFSALVKEIAGPGNVVSVCVENATRAGDSVFVSATRKGAAPTDQQSFLPGTNYEFDLDVIFNPGEIYDGVTLDLSVLGGPITLNPNNSLWEHRIFDVDTNETLELSVGDFTSGTFQLTP